MQTGPTHNGSVPPDPNKSSGTDSVHTGTASNSNGDDGRKKRWWYIGFGASVILLAGILGASVGVVMSRKSSSSGPSPAVTSTVAPTVAAPAVGMDAPTACPTRPKPTASFGRPVETGADLKVAVDAYLTDPSGALTAAEYGHPIGNWNVSLVTDFGELFDETRTFGLAVAAFNEDISKWDGAYC